MLTIIRFVLSIEKLHILKSVLEQESINLFKWLMKKLTKANPVTFQSICVGQKPFKGIDCFDVEGIKIKCKGTYDRAWDKC